MKDEDYASSSLRSWEESQVTEMLDIAQKNLEVCLKSMNLEATIIRKERAIGMIAKKHITREQLASSIMNIHCNINRHAFTNHLYCLSTI